MPADDDKRLLEEMASRADDDGRRALATLLGFKPLDFKPHLKVSTKEKRDTSTDEGVVPRFFREMGEKERGFWKRMKDDPMKEIGRTYKEGYIDAPVQGAATILGPPLAVLDKANKAVSEKVIQPTLGEQGLHIPGFGREEILGKYPIDAALIGLGPVTRGLKAAGTAAAYTKAGQAVTKTASRTTARMAVAAEKVIHGKDKVLPAFVKAWGETGKATPKATRALGLQVSRYGKGGEAGIVINPVKAYQMSRDAGRAVWGKMFEKAEALLWKGAEGAKIGDWLKRNFATLPVRLGESYAAHIRETFAARELSAIDVMRRGVSLENLSDDAAREATRYLRPRVAGTKATKPSLLDADQIKVLDEFKADIQGLLKQEVDLGLISPEVAKEYAEGWIPRLLQDKAFRKGTADFLRTPIRVSDIHYAKDAYGTVVRLSKGEARSLMKEAGMVEIKGHPVEKAAAEWWDGLSAGERRYMLGSQKAYGKMKTGEQSRVRQAWKELEKPPGEAVVGEAQLSEVVASQGGKNTVVKFHTPQARDEFLKRYKRAYGKKANVRDKFDPMTEEQLKELGEVVDPRANLYNALGRMRTDIKKEQFFKAVSADPALATADEAVAVANGWNVKHRLPEGRRMGSLRGHYVRPDVYRDIQGLDRTLLTTGTKVWRTMLSEWKAGKTIWSARTHARNFLGNTPFAIFADNTPPWMGGLANTKYYGRAVQSLLKKDEMWREMLERGVIGTQYADAELQMLRNIVRVGTPEQVGSRLAEFFKRAGKEITLTKGVAGKKAAALYNAEDALYRAATYIKQRHLGVDPLKAAAHVDRWFPNYANVGPGIAALSNSPLGGPFVRFHAESMRIHYNAIKYRPIKAAAVYGAFPYAVWQVAKASTGMSDAEAEGIRQRGPYALPMFWRNKDGNTDTIALDYVLPAGSVLSGIMGTEYNRDEDIKRFADIIGPFLMQNPAITIPMGMWQEKDPFTGRDIQQTGETKFGSKIRFALEQLAPGALHPAHYIPSPTSAEYRPLGREGKKITDLVRGRPYWSGEERTAGRTAIDTLLGLNPRPWIPENEKERAGRVLGALEARERIGKSRVKRSKKKGYWSPEEAEREEKRVEGSYASEKSHWEYMKALAEVVRLERKGPEWLKTHKTKMRKAREKLERLRAAK